MTGSDTEVFRIGQCRIYPGTGVIERDGQQVQLEPKVMALLCHLVDNAGLTLSREQLFEALWPGVVVTDDTLTQAMIKLRKALGDSARKPRYIQTIPKRGYRLAATVEAEAPNPRRLFSGVRPRRFVYLLAALLLVGGTWFYRFVDDLNSHADGTAITQDIGMDTKPSLMVEPFRLLDDDTSQAYLAQGITNNLIVDLSGLSGLWVIGPRSVSEQTEHSSIDHQAVGYRVSGEVQRVGEQLRITVHLADVEQNRQLWSQRYRVPMDDLFDLQVEMTQQIASTLSLKVSEEERRRLARRYTRNTQAYEYFLQAQSLLLVRLKPENERAQSLYRQAIALDPSFSRAYAGLALSMAAEYRNQWTVDGDAALERARALAKTALQIDPDIPEVYWVLAYVSAQQRQHQKALNLLQKAISLDRSYADAYALMGGINTYLGQSDKSPPLLRTAIRLNPQAGYLYYLLLGRAYFYLGDWEQARINLNEALMRNPANLETRIYLAAVMESSGAHDDAVWQVNEIQSLQTHFDPLAWLQTYPMTDNSQRERLHTALTQIAARE